jgi:predicted NodU family carbamoyl transferase
MVKSSVNLPLHGNLSATTGADILGCSVGTEYFLSCYLSSPGALTALELRHDQSVALWQRSDRRVELVRLWEVERISGQKHHQWPLFTSARSEDFLKSLLAREGLTLNHISAAWGTPGLPGYQEIELPAAAEAFPVHSLSHLFSGLLLDTRLFKNETIVGLAVDGAPDNVLDRRTTSHWYTGCVSHRGHMTFMPIESPAPLYSAASTLFGLEPGSLMALATVCRTTISFDVEAACASLTLFGGRVDPMAAASALVREITRVAEEQLSSRALDSEFSRTENLQSAVMKHVQHACDLISIRNVEKLCSLGKLRPEDAYLSTSGGFALNCPTNTMLLDRFGFRGLLTPPCANDSGQALGLGLLGLYSIGAFENADFMIGSPYHGMPLRDVGEALIEFEPWIAEDAPFDARQFASDISNSVLAWVDGEAEIGPRALGHRSLLGDPRSSKIKDALNQYKKRQWWRPVAPIVLAEQASRWFEQERPSPYMLEAAQVRAEVIDQVPAIVHFDGSARHQTLAASADPLLHCAIEAFYKETGIPMLCNTSLNDKGEPIVNTAAEALTFCVNKGIRLIYLAGRRVALRDEPVPAAEHASRPRQREVKYFSGQENDRDALWQKWLDQGYSEEAISLLLCSPNIRSQIGSVKPATINKIAQHYHSTDEGIAAFAATLRRDLGPGSSFIRTPDDLPEPVIIR